MIFHKFSNVLRFSPRHLRWNGVLHSGFVSVDNNKFQADLDVHEFTPEEITVKVLGTTVTVEGKHDEKQDEYGYISRHFLRKYVLPEGHDVNKIESKLSSDGMLTIIAPRTQSEKEEERTISIVQTGVPSNGTMECKKSRRKKHYQVL